MAKRNPTGRHPAESLIAPEHRGTFRFVVGVLLLAVALLVGYRATQQWVRAETRDEFKADTVNATNVHAATGAKLEEHEKRIGVLEHSQAEVRGLLIKLDANVSVLKERDDARVRSENMRPARAR